MRVAALLERGAAEDRRRFLRHPVKVGAGLAGSDRPAAPVTVTDLSSHGCGHEVAGHCEPGARVWLKLPGLESWSARIAWAEHGRAGLSFDRPLHPGVVERYT